MRVLSHDGNGVFRDTGPMRTVSLKSSRFRPKRQAIGLHLAQVGALLGESCCNVALSEGRACRCQPKMSD